MSNSLMRTWDDRVETWHHHVTDSPAFEEVRQETLRLAAPRPGDRCVDLGAGTGFLSLPLARQVDHVLAVDISSAMMEALRDKAAEQGLRNVDAEAIDLNHLVLPPASHDLVVSSYALHHVDHAGKRRVAARARRWLRPGGRIVIADMMFGRGASANDRKILAAKVRSLAAKGPGGIWRIAKNLTRYGLRVGDEMPAPPEFWTRALGDAGFAGVGHVQVFQEAGIVWGRVPDKGHRRD